MLNKNKGGRPLKFKSEKILQDKIEAYFKSCWRQKIDMFGNPLFIKDEKGKKTNKPVMEQWKPYTMTGLAVFLDCDHEVITDYERKGRYSATIKRARDIIRNFAEDFLFSGKNPTGVIFNLKNNWGWKDKSETDITSGGQPIPILGKDTDVIFKNNSNKEASKSH